MLDEKTRLIMKTLTVLYVEDEETIREQLVESLKRKFLHVLSASNGEEGLDLFNKNQPDLIITDIKMPKMDGLSMITEIKEINMSVPIIVITAYSDLNNLQRAIELDVDRFLQKPIKKNDLDNALLKSTLSIIKQKEIDDRDKIIKTILGWNPHFSMICSKDNVHHVTSEFMGIVGIHEKEVFINDLQNMAWSYDTTSHTDKDISFDNRQNLLTEITNHENTYYVVFANTEKYEVKARYYETTELYLLSFFKVITND